MSERRIQPAPDYGHCPDNRSLPFDARNTTGLVYRMTAESLYPEEVEAYLNRYTSPRDPIDHIEDEDFFRELYGRGLIEKGFVNSRTIALGAFAWAIAACEGSMAKGNPQCEACPLYPQNIGETVAETMDDRMLHTDEQIEQDLDDLYKHAQARGIPPEEVARITMLAMKMMADVVDGRSRKFD